MDTWQIMSDPENTNCNATLEYGQLTPAPDGMDGQDELMCAGAESLYQTSCSQDQDQDDFPEDFSCFYVPTLLTGLEEEEDMDDFNTQTTICTEDVYTGNICFLEEQEARKSLKRKHSELCCMDDLDIVEPFNKLYIDDGLDKFQNNIVIENTNNQFLSPLKSPNN